MVPEVSEANFDLPPFQNSLDENNKFLNNEIQLQKSAPMDQTLSRDPIHSKK
jgi:hypothetical protein